MGFGHEQLDVYRAAIEYAGWAYRVSSNDTDAEALCSDTWIDKPESSLMIGLSGEC